MLASLLQYLGLNAHHESLTIANASPQVLYGKINDLGDLWSKDKDQYYRFTTDFFDHYITNLSTEFQNNLQTKVLWKNVKASLRNIPDYQGALMLKSKKHVIDCNNVRVPAVPVIQNKLSQNGIKVKTVVLVRNPFKTIHALYKVEGKSNFEYRPKSFLDPDLVTSAANVWKETYNLIYDQIMHAGGNYYLLILEKFSNDQTFVKPFFDFIELQYSERLYKSFMKFLDKQPYRTQKVTTIRNSDLFHDPEFSFNESQLDQIQLIIQNTASLYKLDLDNYREEYVKFHRELDKRIFNN